MRAFPIALLLALAACAGEEGPQDARVAIPAAWARVEKEGPFLAVDSAAQVEQDWWKHFADPTLETLLKKAVAGNPTLAIARARVDEARADRLAARAVLLPEINGTASAQRINQGYFFNDKPIGVAQANLEARWELDLFGRNQERLAAAKAILSSNEDARQAVLVELLAETARTYFELRNTERQFRITERNLALQKQTLELTRAQLEGAYASEFDVQRAAAQVSITEARLPSLSAARDRQLNRLSVLTGAPPGTEDVLLSTPEELRPLAGHTVVTAPANILLARPDVRASERRFAASISNRKAAMREWFPTVTLLGLFGVQETTLINANPWSIGINLVQPILNFGRIESLIDRADAQQEQAYQSYRSSVLTALEDMQNALAGYGNETKRNGSLRAAVAQTRKAAELARLQFTSGYLPLLDVLIADRAVLDAESALAESDTELRTNLVAIYTAAGGGWQPFEPGEAQ